MARINKDLDGWKKLDDSRFPPSVNWDETEELIGEVKEFKTVEMPDRTRRCAILLTANGEITVWETVGLRVFFDKVSIGTLVRIVNKGWAKGKRGRRFRSFEIYIK